MKRNIILMGGKTHVISLPLKWVKKYGIKKGEDINKNFISQTGKDDDMNKVIKETEILN